MISRLVFPLGGAAGEVVHGGLVEPHPADEDAVQRGVSLAVPTAVESVAGSRGGGGGDGAGAAP